MYDRPENRGRPRRALGADPRRPARPRDRGARRARPRGALRGGLGPPRPRAGADLQPALAGALPRPGDGDRRLGLRRCRTRAPATTTALIVARADDPAPGALGFAHQRPPVQLGLGRARRTGRAPPACRSRRSLVTGAHADLGPRRGRGARRPRGHRRRHLARHPALGPPARCASSAAPRPSPGMTFITAGGPGPRTLSARRSTRRSRALPGPRPRDARPAGDRGAPAGLRAPAAARPGPPAAASPSRPDDGTVPRDAAAGPRVATVATRANCV